MVMIDCGDCYVYTFASSLDGKVFYVGKGIGTGSTGRIHSHIYESVGKRTNVSPVAARIREIWRQGGKLIIRKPYSNLSDADALDMEKVVISCHKREQLVNRL